MATPNTGDIQHFYCDCIETKTSERSHQSRGYDSESKERTVTHTGPQTTSWGTRSRHFHTFRVKTGFLKSYWIFTYEYWWECMNCGKKRKIGVRDTNGVCYGDGDQAGLAECFPGAHTSMKQSLSSPWARASRWRIEARI